MRGLAAIVFMTFAAIIAAALAFSSDAAPVTAPKFAQSAGAIPVDVELVIAVDVSYSMDPEEQALQREGYIQALTSREFMQALREGANGKVAITYFEWAGEFDQKIIMPWRLIEGPESADAVAAEIAAAPYRRASRTSISGGLMFAKPLFDRSGYRGLRRVIDVSGDGTNNAGALIVPTRDDVLAAGITINGLPIMLKRPVRVTMDIENLDVYYEDCVIGGPGAFVIPIKEREKFTEATRTKLVQEVAGLQARAAGRACGRECAAHFLHHRRAEVARALGQLKRATRRRSEAGKLAAIDVLAVIEPRVQPFGVVVQSGPLGRADRHGEIVLEIAVAGCRRAGIVHFVVGGLGQRLVFGDFLSAVLVGSRHHGVSAKKSRISM